jgi:hypothetical protein
MRIEQRLECTDLILRGVRFKKRVVQNVVEELLAELLADIVRDDKGIRVENGSPERRVIFVPLDSIVCGCKEGAVIEPVEGWDEMCTLEEAEDTLEVLVLAKNVYDCG